MKYTKYLIKGNYIDVTALETDWILLKIPARIMSIAVAFCGLAVISSMIPLTVLVDEARNTKCIYIHFKRRGYKFEFYEKIRNTK
jgi:hypothetical protein